MRITKKLQDAARAAQQVKIKKKEKIIKKEETWKIVEVMPRGLARANNMPEQRVIAEHACRINCQIAAAHELPRIEASVDEFCDEYIRVKFKITRTGEVYAERTNPFSRVLVERMAQRFLSGFVPAMDGPGKQSTGRYAAYTHIGRIE